MIFACVRLGLVVATLATAVVAGAPPTQAQTPRLLTNEAYVEDVLRQGALDVEDPSAVLAFVLSSLGPSVRVYPTENYYYFRFVLNGVPFAGSVRLGPRERDAGKVEIGYYKDLAEWNDALVFDRHAVLGAAQGVVVERVDGLRYRVSHKGASVIFELNDLSGSKPPPGTLLAGEKFIGPIFDESGIRFFLIYSSRHKIFHYALDETAPVADELEKLAGAERVLVGRRTGFAFFQDQFAPRKILVGVHEGNSRLNTYFDGPFDQLPENFIEGEALREAIIDADPEAKGQIDRLGNYHKEEGRYVIHPYMLYRQTRDLQRFSTCASQNAKRPDKYHACFAVEPELPTSPGPAPAAPGSRK